MEDKTKLDRRDFLSLSAMTSLGSLLPAACPQISIAFPDNHVGALELKVNGDANQGYGVSILFRGKPIARHNSGGEFSALFQNGERSLEDRVENWKATSWTGDPVRVTLNGEAKLTNLRTTAFVQVTYEVIGANLVRKSIRLHQSDMFMLFYQLSNRLEPVTKPATFWSFDQVDCRGGALHEYFPSAGFRTENGISMGLLTDAGYRNQWSRMIRRDGTPVKPAPDRIPDVNLYTVSGAEDCRKGNYFVQQTFGESLQQVHDTHSGEVVQLPQPSTWTKQGKVTVDARDSALTLSTLNPDDGVILPFPGVSGSIYSLRLEYRSQVPVAFQIWDVNEQLQKLNDITLFNDRAPASPETWSQFSTTVFVPTLQGAGAALFISTPEPVKRTGPTKIELHGLEMRRIDTLYEPYHRLEMDHPEQKTVFLFVDETIPATLRGYRLANQLHLADALGFRGGDTEKVLYADLMMLCWIADTESLRPIVAPSIWYSAAGEMYLRDSFFALNGIHNQTLNENVFTLWGENQGEDGAINTLVEPELANLERKSNDSTPLWLIWALLNRRRFGMTLPMEKVRKAAEYCLHTYDPKEDSICTAQFVMGQLDIITYPHGTSDICQNQGLLAVLLRVIRELKIPGVSSQISEERITKAEEAYRSYYDPARRYLLPARNILDAIGLAELFPEYLSLWLFDRKILTDEMVVNHLDRIPVMLPRNDAPHPEVGGTVRPIFIGLSGDRDNWKYFIDKWHPMASDSYAADYAGHAMDGIYYNGGSWMRLEVCSYVVGQLHGWSKAKKAIANRLWAEINISPDYPTSQEYLPTDPLHPFYGYHRVFAWNAFVLQALEQAGLRSPRMDPDFTKHQAL
jgi:hypothetical protein